MNNYGKTLVAFLTGIATGAALGILFAPWKGSETRRKIDSSARKFADTIRNKAEEGMDTISETAGKKYDKVNTGGHPRSGRS